MHFTNSISLVFLGSAILALYSYPSLLPSRKMAEESPKSVYDFTVKVMFNLLPSFSLFAVWLVRKREKVENTGQSLKLLLFVMDLLMFCLLIHCSRFWPLLNICWFLILLNIIGMGPFQWSFVVQDSDMDIWPEFFPVQAMSFLEKINPWARLVISYSNGQWYSNSKSSVCFLLIIAPSF